ncbi:MULTISPECIES: HEAT repeat domain-containing protein [Actinomadura]|uniref:HEAT repeat domain-containing protein n=1 Tax=unclassified Actinomadura TaxID=2626254 RepID=UPI003397B53B
MALSEPNEIDWARLRFASGGPGPLFDLVRELAEQTDMDEDPRNGGGGLFLPGSLYAESIPVLPALAELAASGEVGVRADALNLLARMSREANDHHDPEWESALRGVLPGLLALLDDPDAGVRLAATRVLAAAVGDPEPAVRALCGAWAEDDDEAVRLCAVLAVTNLARQCSAAILPEALIWLRDRAAKGSPHVRMAASVSLARLVGAERADPDAVTEAMAAPSVQVWRYVPELEPPDLLGLHSGTARQLVHWVDDRLGDDLAARIRLSAVLGRHGDADRRGEGVKIAAVLAAAWRSAAAELLPVLAERAGDDAVENALHALHVIAAMGPDAATHTDLLAARLDDDRRLGSGTDLIADVAAWGLAWRGDPRCLPHLAARLGDEGLVYGPGDLGGGNLNWYSTALPGIADVLAPLGDHAAVLLPVIRDRLGDVPETPPYAHVRARPSRAEEGLVRLVGAWGAAGTPAVPELIGLLGSRLEAAAAEALAALGPAAGDAGPAVEEELRQRGHIGHRPDGLRWLALARAHWRITGDPARLIDAVHAQAGPRSLPEDLLPYIADLGPHAAAHEPWVRYFIDSRHERVRFAASYALGRIGRPAVGSAVLASELDRLADGDHRPASLPAVRHLAALGTAPNGRRDELRAIMDADHRHRASGGWRSFTEDREMRQLAATLLALTEH